MQASHSEAGSGYPYFQVTSHYLHEETNPDLVVLSIGANQQCLIVLFTFSITLICGYFNNSNNLPTVESADNAELDKAVNKLNLEDEMNAYITQLCKDIIHLLKSGDILVADRTTLVEKCLIFYNRLLDFKHAGKLSSIWHCIVRLPKFQI